MINFSLKFYIYLKKKCNSLSYDIDIIFIIFSNSKYNKKYDN